MKSKEAKICRSCGRRFEWRKRWAQVWDDVRYCSAACRARKVSRRDRELEEVILELLNARDAGKTVCPSEAARLWAARAAESAGRSPDDEGWRSLMEPTRRAARRLVAAGQLEITQRGLPVDATTAKGVIRLRLV